MVRLPAYPRLANLIQVYEVATFIQCFRSKPVSEHNPRFAPTCPACCGALTTSSIMLRKARSSSVVKVLLADGRIYLKREEECLAACCGAPMMMIDHKYHENLTTAQVDAIRTGSDGLRSKTRLFQYLPPVRTSPGRWIPMRKT
jgi:NADH-quinone oxidoreductase subunit E